MQTRSLLGLGFVSESIAGIQLDVNAAHNKQGEEASLCDHACVQQVNGVLTGGKYDCPIAFVSNKGIIPQLAPADYLVRGVLQTAKGTRLAREQFLADIFPDYCARFRIPSAVAEDLVKIWQEQKLEVNLFGGNPEMHKEIAWIIQQLIQEGFSVTLTTTGRRFLDPKWAAQVLQTPPHLVALSADDFESPEHIFT